MNEVNLTQAASARAQLSSASSKGAAAEAAPRASGKELPDQTVNPAANEKPQASQETQESLQNAVSEVNDYVQSIQRDLQFTVDEDLERTIIRVVDSDSGDVVRQIPEDIFLELARRLKEDGEFHLVNALG